MKSSFIQPILAGLTLVVFLVTMFINFSASKPEIGIFQQPTGNVSDKYPVDITPSGWTFALWGIIYTYMAVALGYGLSQFCRMAPGSSGALSSSPVTLSSVFWLMLTADLVLNSVWLIVWDRELLTVCAVVLWIVAVVNWLIMVTLHRCMDEARSVWLQFSGVCRELTLLIACVINGLAVYTTWTTVAALLNTNITLVHVAMFSSRVCSTVILAVLATIVLVYFILDCTLLDRFTRWTLTPYFTLVWAALGIFTNNYRRLADESSHTATMIAVLLTEVCVLLVVRLVLLFIFRSRRPWCSKHAQVKCKNKTQ